MYCFIIWSVTFPLLTAKYPLAHRWHPQNLLFNSLYSCSNFLEDAPFIYFIALLTDRCGGIETSKCTWSFDTCPFSISISFLLHISRILARTLFAISPFKTFLRYFVTHTRWTCRLYLLWDDVLYSLILPFYQTKVFA